MAAQGYHVPTTVDPALRPLDWDPRETVVDLSEIDLTTWSRGGDRQVAILEQVGPAHVLSSRNGTAYVACAILRNGNVKGRKTRLHIAISRWTKRHGVWRLYVMQSMSAEAAEAFSELWMREGDELLALWESRL